MNKAILLLSGNPSGKTSFINTIKKSAWIWNINHKDYIAKIARNYLYYTEGERDAEYYTFIESIARVLNTQYNFQQVYVEEMIRKFLSDESEYFTDKDGKKFDSFVLVIHGLGKDTVKFLKENYGAFHLCISARILNSNIEIYDTVLYEDDGDFEAQSIRTLNILTNNGKDKKLNGNFTA